MFNQRGSGLIKHYDGAYLQQGAGFGSFFKGAINFLKPLARALKPVIKSKFVRDIGKDLLSTGLDVATETFRGKKLKESAKDNLKVAKKRVINTIHQHTKPKSGSQEGGGAKKMKIQKFATTTGDVAPSSFKKRKRRKKIKTKKPKRVVKRKMKRKSKKRTLKRVLKEKRTIFD